MTIVRDGECGMKNGFQKIMGQEKGKIMRRKKAAVLGALCTLFAFMLTACGGGGGTGGYVNSGIGNKMTVTVDGAAPVTYTEGALNGYGYYDPDMEGEIATSGRAGVTLSSGGNGGPR